MTARSRSWPSIGVLSTAAAAPAVVAFTLLIAGSSGPAAAQEPPAAGAFGETVEVRVVNVEVVVTDRAGNRVTGLRPGDFRLRVDGKETPIDYFTEVTGGTVATAAADAAPSAPIPPPGLEVAAGEPVGTSYLVYVDDVFARSGQRNQTLDALQKDLGRLGPRDRMAVVAFDGEKLEMLSSWTASAAELGRAFDRARTRPAHGVRRLAEQRTVDDPGVELPMAGGGMEKIDSPGRGMGFEETELIQQLTERLERSVAATTATMRGFGQPPGRKVLLLLAGGWPFSPAEYVYSPTAPGKELDWLADEGKLYGPLADTANRLGYTVYGVDVPGLRIDFERQGAERIDSDQVGASDRREAAGHGAIEFLAQETGGKAILNGPRDAALAIAHEDTRSYYWLGFTPPGAADDRRHRIQVEALRPGLSVRSRTSFLAASRSAEAAAMAESALLFGGAPSEAGPQLTVELGQPVPAGRKVVDVPVEIAIPAAAVTVLQVEGRWAAKLELRLAAVDERGNRSEMPVVPLSFENPGPPNPRSLFRYGTTLRLKQSRHEVVVSVFDPLSGKTLTTKAEVDPGR